MPTNVPACQRQAATVSLLQSELCLLLRQPRGRQGEGEALSAALAAAQGPAQRLWGEFGSPSTANLASAGVRLPASGSYSISLDMGCTKGTMGIFEAYSRASHPPCWAASAGDQQAGTGTLQGAKPFPSTGSPEPCWLWEGCRSPSPDLLGFPGVTAGLGWRQSEVKGEHPPC